MDRVWCSFEFQANEAKQDCRWVCSVYRKCTHCDKLLYSIIDTQGVKGEQGERGGDGFGRIGTPGPQGPSVNTGAMLTLWLFRRISRLMRSFDDLQGIPGADGYPGHQGERGEPGIPAHCSNLPTSETFFTPFRLSRTIQGVMGRRAVEESPDNAQPIAIIPRCTCSSCRPHGLNRPRAKAQHR